MTTLSYDYARVAYPLSTSDIPDISIGLGDVVRYYRAGYGSFTGTVTGYDAATDRYAVETADAWGTRIVLCGAERLQLVVKAGALDPPAPLHTEADAQTAQVITLVQQNTALIALAERMMRLAGVERTVIDGWDFRMVAGKLTVTKVGETRG